MVIERQLEHAAPHAMAPLRCPTFWHPADRHVRVGISHASDDPARHRTFEIRATYDVALQGWVADVGEQNLNEQRGDWVRLLNDDPRRSFPTAAACLGHVMAILVAAFDQDAETIP